MFSTQRVLVIDDDVRIRNVLRQALEREGYEAIEASDAASGLGLLERGGVDLVALDIGLPGEDGFSAARRLRATSDVPLVMITGRSDTIDTVLALELGADDYICKPFHIREVVARIRAVLRRQSTAAARRSEARVADIVVFDGWRLDLARRELVGRDGAEHELTGAEFDLLKLFVTNPNRVLSRDTIMESLKGRAWSPYDRGIDMQVRRLRRKVEDDPACPRRIRTVRGSGYLFAATVQRLQREVAPQFGET